MPFLVGEDSKKVRKILSNIPNKVKIIYFTQELECQFCREIHLLVQEVKEHSNGKIDLEVYNFINDREYVDKYKIDKIPAIAITSETKDYGIRYYGIPSGYEFSSLLEDIQEVSKGEPSVSEETKKLITKITHPLHLQVFVTPTCPYCPGAVLLAHKLAMLNDNIKADMIEATEFPHLSMRYNVQGVPRTMIGEKDAIEGALPESNYVKKVMDVYQKLYPDN
jgi:glutaredoxin-like protein